MHCGGCQNAISPGMELSLPTVGVKPRHCPYCLHQLPSPRDRAAADSSSAGNVSVERFEHRRQVREQFVERLLRSSSDGAPHCPSCEQRLDKDDELALRNGEHFHCQHCAADLAQRAYLEAAYDRRRWQPVLQALRQLQSEPRCAGCAYFGAVAVACQRALAAMPSGEGPDRDLVDALLARSSWTVPECDWSSACLAVEQYRKHAAEGVALL